MLLEMLFRILENAKQDSKLINKVRYSPQQDAIIVDINYNKVIRVVSIGNEVHVQGDEIIGNEIKKIIEGALQKCQ